MYESIWKSAINHLSSDRMKKDVEEFFEESRWSSFDRIVALAKRIAAKMEALGLVDVRLIELPADGRTAFGGWVIPKAYDVKAARLTEIVDGNPGAVLAEYHENPTSLMMYSQPTRPGGICAELAIADRLEEFSPERVAGRLVLTSGLGLDYSRAAMRAGACGLISDFRGQSRFIKEGAYLDAANEWHNYTIPPMDEPRKGFGFAITPNQGRSLRDRIRAGQTIHLHAVVDSRHYDGVLPVVTGRLPGMRAEEIVITGHYDEFGADDNCSQVAVALEVVRAIQAMARSGEIPRLERSIRLLFPMEVRGFNALAQRSEEILPIRLGINIDTVGTDQNAVTTVCTLTENFMAAPSFADDFVAELLERVREENPLFRWRLSDADTIDNIFGEPRIGAPTPCIYHFSGSHHLCSDTPDRLSSRMLQDMARLTATYAAFMARAGLGEALWLSELAAERGLQRIQALAARSLRGSAGNVPQGNLIERLQALEERYLEKIASARWLIPYAEIYPTAENLGQEAHLLHGDQRLLPRDLYDSHVASLQARITRAREEAEKLVLSRATFFFRSPTPYCRPPTAPSRCVPVKNFNGFLSFEDLSPEELEHVRKELNIGIGWGAPLWLQNALMLANGKRTAGEIADFLRRHAAGGPDAASLEKIFHFLASRKFVRLRKYLTPNDVQEALRHAGLTAGDVVLGHFSLSQFGYLEGGADRLIEAMTSVLGPSGTLMMPTFTFSWIGHRPYDPAQTPSVVGAVTDRFWRRPGVLRSAHPTHSFAAAGKLACHLLEGHDSTKSPLSRDGPIGKLADRDGKILMFCGIGPNTCMHAGDYWSGIPLPDIVCHLLENGVRREVTVPGCPWHAVFSKAYEKLYACGLVCDVPLGESTIHTLRCRDAIAAQAEVARETPEALIPAGCTCPYCVRLRKYCEEITATAKKEVSRSPFQMGRSG